MPIEYRGGESIDLGNLPIVEPEDGILEGYANVVNFNWTLTDVRLRFGELVRQPRISGPATWKDEGPVILERVAVTLPWQQVKTLCLTLGTLLQRYEELNGEITVAKLPTL